jgi:hypothetical protein
VTAKVGLVTEQEVEAFYQTNKVRLRGEEAVVGEQVRTYLQQQKRAAERARFVEALRLQAKVKDQLQPPPIVRLDMPVDGAPVSGPASWRSAPELP